MRFYTRTSRRSGVSVGGPGMIYIGFAWLLVIAVLVYFWYITVGVVLALFVLGVLLESRKRRRQSAKAAAPAEPVKAGEGPRDWEPQS